MVFVPVHLLAHTRPLVHSQQSGNTSHGNTSSFSMTVLVNKNKRLWHVPGKKALVSNQADGVCSDLRAVQEKGAQTRIQE